jgi:hypothetical protein
MRARLLCVLCVLSWLTYGCPRIIYKRDITCNSIPEFYTYSIDKRGLIVDRLPVPGSNPGIGISHYYRALPLTVRQREVDFKLCLRIDAAVQVLVAVGRYKRLTRPHTLTSNRGMTPEVK